MSRSDEPRRVTVVPFEVAERRGRWIRPAVALRGEADLESVPQMRTAIELCLRGPGRQMAIDVSALTFCDVSGLNAFLDGAEHAADSGRHLTLRRPSAQVVRLLALAGCAEILLGRRAARQGSGCRLLVRDLRRRARGGR
jgi:anti-anti-sigma factor